MVVLMAKVGNFYSKVLKLWYSRICCRICRIVRRRQENKNVPRIDQVQIKDDKVGEESWMPTEKVGKRLQ